jgi:hypothetical protein
MFEIQFWSHFGVLLVQQNWFKPPEAGLLKKSLCLARALGVAKFTNMRDVILVTLCYAT